MGQTGETSTPASGSFNPKDPVAVSAVREHAISVIDESASSKDPQVRANAVEGASLAPDRLKSVIGRGLTDPSAGVRTVAAMSVGKARVAELCSGVRPLLDDQSAFVRAAAIFALARCGQPVDRTPLAGMLLRDPSARLRSHVAFILGELGDPSALSLLRQAVEESTRLEPGQRRFFELQACEAMVKLGDRAQCSAIQAALHPSHPEELENIALACQLIGEIRDTTAAAQLVSLADYSQVVGDPKQPSGKQTYPAEVRLAAAGALSALGVGGTGAPSIAAEYATSKSAPIRAQAAYVFGQIGGHKYWGKLDAMMGDPSGDVRVSAAAAVLRSHSKPLSE
jgi:hypothetical protein